MIAESSTLRRILILADESANWRVAGLRQLDRLMFNLQEFAASDNRRSRLHVCVFWNPGRGSWGSIPNLSNLERLQISSDAAAFLAESVPTDLILHTRVFAERGGVQQLVNCQPATRVALKEASAQDWESLALIARQHCAEMSGAADAANLCVWISDPRDIPQCERMFLARSGKPQDGIVSRSINRPMSRAISRLLLKCRITPSEWTLLILPIPIAASLFFMRGDYASVLIGTLLFQAYSVLDGCDGEIARAKFLESERGARLDTWCDIFANVLLAISLGFGLERGGSIGTLDHFYLLEGIAVGALILLNEWLLSLRKTSSPSTSPLYPRHQQLVAASPLLRSLGSLTSFIFAITKRDVAVLFFVALVLIGRAAWILHLLGVVAAVSSALAAHAILRTRQSSYRSD